MKVLPLPRARTRALHLLALSAFAIAEPELQELGRTPEYFVVRGYHTGDVVLYSLALVLFAPLLLMGIELLVGYVYQPAVRVIHPFFVCALVFLIIEDVLARYPLQWNVVLTVALVVMFATAYRFWMPAHAFLTIAAFAPILFVAVFLAKTNIGSMSLSAPPGVTMSAVKSNTPVVLVVFDEFSLSSLLTADGRIDRVRYPNFAAFGRSSTWFRSATTVYDVTDRAVPAILTGRLRRYDQLPIVSDHPRNLFTLLGGSYGVRAFQAETRLCPTNLCSSASPSLRTRLTRVFADVKTTSLRRRPIWEGDWGAPADEVARFLDSIEPSERPQLHVLHVLLPHVPYQYLPSGRAYADGRALPGYNANYRWIKNPWFVDHNYERYLLQLGYTDEVLGKIVARLRSAGLWDRSLVIVTADHGVSFHPGGHRRYADLDNVGDIAPVPMFVKRPGQRTGRVDRLGARSIDIVPTIAQQLGVRVPWKLDGTSLFAPNRRPPSRIVVRSYTGDVVRASWASVEAGQRKTLAWKLRLFGSGEDSVLAEGADRRLVGTSIAMLPSWRSTTIRASVIEPSKTVLFDPRSRTAPSRVRGIVTGLEADKVLRLAIAVNGRIAAVTKTTRIRGRTWFSTFVLDSVLRPGNNAITVLALRLAKDGQPALARIGSTGTNSRLVAAAP
jgi:hypothetical protein